MNQKIHSLIFIKENSYREVRTKKQFSKSKFSFLLSFLIVVSISTIFSSAQAQDSDLEVGLINISAGSIIGGIGAIINKKDDERFFKTLAKGMAQGALGGYAVFESKRIVRVFARTGDYNYVWPSQFLNAAGNSIIENAASNRNLWDQWHLNLGFTRLDIFTENGFRIKYRIKPFSLYGAVQVWRGNKLDWNKSLKLGALVFRLNEIESNGNNFRGATLYDHIILLDGNKSPLQTEAHELIHIYQIHQLSGVNTYINPVYNPLKSKLKVLSIYDNIFYTDWHNPLYTYLVNLDQDYASPEKRNIFEREAYYLVK